MLNLPLVLDIAIGLVFVYISLSLVASEIQEIINTLLQLRAKHLKNSIKYLLMGSDVDTVDEIKQTKQLIDELYSNPLIKNLNHQGQGTISHWLKTRRLSNAETPNKLKEKLIREVTKIKVIDSKEFEDKIKTIANDLENEKNGLEISRVKFKEILNNLLIQKSTKKTRDKLIKIKENLLDNPPLPSYIPSDTFATTLLEVLRIPRLTHYLSCNKLKGLIKRLFKKLSEIEGLDQKTLENFIEAVKEIYDNFCNKKYTLEISLLSIKTRLNELIFENSDNGEDKDNNILVEKLTNIRKMFFEGNNFEILCQEMKLNLIYIAQILNSDFLDENGKLDPNKKAKILEEANNTEEKWDNETILSKFNKEFNNEEEQIKSQQVQREIEDILGKLPKTLKDSIVTLAHRAQTRIENTQQDIEQLSQEIETWFNNSMERASGVYRRNSKGLALIISFVIAFIANADSFHMISRLSTDSILRDALVKSAENLEQTCNSDDKFDCIKITTQENLEQLSLPLGWSCVNFEEQTGIPFIDIPFIDWRLCDDQKNNITEKISQKLVFNNVSKVKSEEVMENNMTEEQPKKLVDNHVSQEQSQGVVDYNLQEEKPEQLMINNDLEINFKQQFNWPIILIRIGKTFLGLVISSIAISMGASFWFDVLGKIVNVRNTGMKPTSTTQESTKSS